MSQVRKVECSYVCKGSVAEMHNFWTTKLSLTSTVCPDHIRSVDLLQGRWGKQGTVLLWNYTIQGEAAIVKNVMEVIDKENYSIIYKAVEGGLLEYFKSFVWNFQASPYDKVVRWTIQFEKKNEDVPDPTAFLDTLLSMMAQIDAYLTSP